MKISELIEMLEEFKEKNGDMDIKIHSLIHKTVNPMEICKWSKDDFATLYTKIYD